MHVHYSLKAVQQAGFPAEVVNAHLLEKGQYGLEWYKGLDTIWFVSLPWILSVFDVLQL